MSEVKEFDIKWTMVVDLDKCTGCGACMVACQAENNVAPNPDGTNKVRSINWMKVPMSPSRSIQHRKAYFSLSGSDFRAEAFFWARA